MEFKKDGQICHFEKKDMVWTPEGTTKDVARQTDEKWRWKYFGEAIAIISYQFEGRNDKSSSQTTGYRFSLDRQSSDHFLPDEQFYSGLLSRRV